MSGHSVFIFIGLMFVGMGIGLLYGRVAAGTLIGLGLGFIGWALAERHGGKSSEKRE